MRQLGRDLEPADRVAVDEHATAAEPLGAGEVERMQQLAGERVHARRIARLAEPARGDDHGVEALAVDGPAGRDARDGRAQADPRADAEVPRVGPQVGVDLLCRRVERMVVRRREVRERGHRTTRVRVHPGPDAAVRRGRVPLAAEVVARLEHGRVEARLERVLGGDDPAGTGADHGHASSRRQRHGATVPDRPRLRRAMTTFLFYGDTERYPSVRHEIPLGIMDPLLLVVDGGRSRVLTSSLEVARLKATLPDVELALFEELGFYELVESGMSYEAAEIETAVRALERWQVGAAVVAPDLPVAVADRLRGAGIELTVDAAAIALRRRRKTGAELDGINRAQRAAEAGMAAGEALIRAAEPGGGGELRHDGEPLTAERVRAAIRAACAAAGAPAPPDIMVVSASSGGGHDPGSGPLPADLPIVIDLWPRDEESGCWADMTRTFVSGRITDEVAAMRDAVREALEAVRAAARPGVTGRALYDSAAEVIERAGHPTQRTRVPGEVLEHGFYFGLGHGVGLDVHEPPALGLSGHDPLIAGDVIAIEPGIEGIDGIGGVRYEDLLLITDDGCETLTDYPYEL
jgi:Xaa-Pro aminopeptidase